MGLRYFDQKNNVYVAWAYVILTIKVTYMLHGIIKYKIKAMCSSVLGRGLYNISQKYFFSVS